MEVATAPPLALDLAAVEFRWPGPIGFSLNVAELRVERGAKVLLLGESGSGKSTLLSLICGIVAARSGRVAVGGIELRTLPAARRDQFRADRIGIIFQQFNLLPYASPLDNILLPLRFAPERRARTPDPRAEARHLAEALGLPPRLMESRTSATLSVGQQQRVAVARALIGAPPLIVADEPTSALDAATQGAFLDLLFARCEAAGTTLLMVSHDERLAARFDRSLRMEDVARIEQDAARDAAA